MPKLGDVGKTVTIVSDSRHDGHALVNVKVVMGIKGPRGECYVYDSVQQSLSDRMFYSNLNHQGDAVRAFMEFNNGKDSVCSDQR